MPKNIKKPAQESGIIFNMPQPPARKASEYLGAYKSWVYTAVSVIAQDVATINLHLYQKKYVRGQVETDEIMEHEALSLLYYANDFMTQQMLLDITVIYLKLAGEAYWAKLRDASGKVVELWPLRPDWIKVKPSKDNFIEGYLYDPGGTAPKINFPIEDIVPFKDLNPTNAYRGYGTVQAADMAIDTDRFSADWNRTFFFNSAMPGVVFTTEGRVTEEQANRFKKQWQAAFGGIGKGHKVAFLGGGMKPEPLTNTPKDMDFLEQRKLLRDEILATFKVPKTVLGMTEDVNLANAQHTRLAYLESVVSPHMQKIVTHLNEFYLTEWEEDIFFDFDDPAPEDTELNLKIYENALAHGWMTRNEVREKENLPPVEGGDDIYLPFTLQPIGSTKPAEKIAKLFGKKSDEEQGVIVLKGKPGDHERKLVMPIPPKSLRRLREEAFKSNIKRDLHKLIVHTIKEQKISKKAMQPLLSQEKQENLWRQIIAKTDVLEDKMKDQLMTLFEDQEKEVIGNLNLVKYFSKFRRKGKEDSIIFDMDFENEKWLVIFSPFIRDIFVDRAREVFEFLGINAEIDLQTATAIKFLTEDGLKFIKDVNATTSTRLKKTLAEGLAGEEDITQLRDRVQEVFLAANKHRAETIARTEILRATNAGSLEAYKQSKVVIGKQWFTAMDERVCSICAPMHEVIVGINESWNTPVGMVNNPTEVHPNCRCIPTPVVGLEEEENEEAYLEATARQLEKRIKDKAKEKQIETAITQSEEVLERAKEEAENIKEEAKQEIEQEKEEIKEQTKTIAERVRKLLGKDDSIKLEEKENE